MQSDEPDLYEIYKRPEVFAHFGSGPYAREQHIASVSRAVKKWKETGQGDFVAIYQGKAIARLIIYPSKFNDYEVGYVLNPAYWGQGFASEIARSLIEYAFRDGASRVLACARESNKASQAIIHKLGFGQSHKTVGDDGIVRIWYEIDKAQWQQHQE